MRGLLFKGRAFITLLLQNCKCELLICLSVIIWVNLSLQIPAIYQLMDKYFTESRCSGIAGVASIIIGIYVTIWSIFSTSASKINAELLKNKVEGKLFFVIAIGLMEAFLLTFLCVFVPSIIPYFTELIVFFTILTTVSFVKFVILIMVITNLNMKFIVQEIDEQNSKFMYIQIKLDEIYHRIVESDK